MTTVRQLWDNCETTMTTVVSIVDPLRSSRPPSSCSLYSHIPGCTCGISHDQYTTTTVTTVRQQWDKREKTVSDYTQSCIRHSTYWNCKGCHTNPNPSDNPSTVQHGMTGCIGDKKPSNFKWNHTNKNGSSSAQCFSCPSSKDSTKRSSYCNDWLHEK